MSQASYLKVVQIKTTASTAGYAALPGNSASLSINRALLDDTDFQTTGWISRKAGLRDYSLSVTNLYGSTIAALNVIRSAILSGVSLDMQYLPNGTKGFQGRIKVESMGFSGDVAGLESLDLSLQSDGTPLTTV